MSKRFYADTLPGVDRLAAAEAHRDKRRRATQLGAQAIYDEFLEGADQFVANSSRSSGNSSRSTFVHPDYEKEPVRKRKSDEISAAAADEKLSTESFRKPAPRRPKRPRTLADQQALHSDGSFLYRPYNLDEEKFDYGEGSMPPEPAPRKQAGKTKIQLEDLTEDELDQALGFYQEAARLAQAERDAKRKPETNAQRRARLRRETVGVKTRRQPNQLSMDSYIRRVVRADIEDVSLKMQDSRVHERWEYPVLAKNARRESPGDERCRRMSEAMAYLDGIEGYTRSKQQKVMHMAFLAVSYQQYYGEDLQRHLVRLLKQNGWSELRSECVVLAPRRFGKTRGTSIFVACEIVTQPGHDVLVYSNNQRASKMLLLESYKIMKILAANPDFGGHVASLNKNESIGFITREGYENQMFAYPAKPETLRGTGSKAATGTVVAEEFAYMNLQVVFEIIGPTLTRKNVKFIGITTVKGSDSFVTPLTDAKFPDGRSVMLTLNFELVCERCKKAGKANTCKCLMGDIPHWQSHSQHDKLKILMQDNMETFLKEIKGFSIDETVSPAFCQTSCQFLRTDEAIMRTAKIHADVIFTTVDPACGGRYSKFAIVSAIFRNDKMIVVGADACTSDRPENQIDKLVKHINAVRSIPGLEQAKIVFCPESNLGNEGKRLAQDLARNRVEQCYCLMEDVRGNEGIRMTDVFKKEMWMSTNALLLQRRVRWHPLMVSVSQDENYGEEAMRKLIIDELSSYQRKLEYNQSDPLSPPKEKFTGKIGGTCDDHCIAFQVCFKSMEYWNSKPDFYSQLRPLYDPRRFGEPSTLGR